MAHCNRGWNVVVGSCLAAVLIAGGTARGATIGYWRMESDTDGGAGYSVPEESAGNPLVGPLGYVNSATLPADPVPLTGAANTRSLEGGANINGTIASFAALNTESITIEFWVQTDEGDAGLFTRSTGSTGKTFGTDGVVITDPDAVDVRYFVDDGLGGSTQKDFTNVANTPAGWQHMAFTYEKATGIGSLYADGNAVATDDGADNLGLVWGAGTANALLGKDADGGPAPSGGVFDELRISNVALSPASFLNAVPFTGIAKDSFLTTQYGTAGTYYDDVRLFNGVNNAITEGTVGFSAAKEWGGGTGDTSNYDLDNDSAATGGLTHNLLTGELEGALRLKAKDPRRLERQLEVAVPLETTYYISALLHATKIEAANVMSIGFSNGNEDRGEGVHIGFNGDNIAVFAGGTAFDLLPGAVTLGETYLVLAELTANPGSPDTLTVFYAMDGDAEFSLGLYGQSVETFSSVADLGYLQVHLDGSGINTNDRLWWMDEVRLASTISDLGIDPATIPEPATGALAAAGLAGLVRRRRRK